MDVEVCERILTARTHGRNFWLVVRFFARFGPHLFFVEMFAILVTSVLDPTPWPLLAARGTGIAVLAALSTKVVSDRIGQSVARQRPFVQHEFTPLLPKNAADPSFPSNHAGGAFALGVALSLAFPALVVPSLLLAALLATARVLAGLHYVTDVVTGALLGTVFALLFSVLVPHF